jgi:hypothetical protein
LHFLPVMVKKRDRDDGFAEHGYRRNAPGIPANVWRCSSKL